MTTALEAAQKNYEQAKAKLQKAKSRETEKRRKKETRAKILLGGWMIAQAKKDPKAAERMQNIIAQFSERDRATFDGLDLLNEQETGHE
ncbi:mobilization protein [Flexibacterium corallicola]|uniref:mobilization protein n=1 Tax=Flexibacterium corallicola TaxID=3037259 RepID=UPI00286F46FC|nr:mobilization protein [Pseudovibrio sp. M1P-2-3]